MNKREVRLIAQDLFMSCYRWVRDFFDRIPKGAFLAILATFWMVVINPPPETGEKEPPIVFLCLVLFSLFFTIFHSISCVMDWISNYCDPQKLVTTKLPLGLRLKLYRKLTNAEITELKARLFVEAVHFCNDLDEQSRGSWIVPVPERISAIEIKAWLKDLK